MNEEPVVLHQRSSRTIVKPIINQETNKYEYTPEVKKESKDEIIYQPVKLIKETESRTDESNHTVKALKRARSLEFLAPDTRFNSILEDLRFVPGQPSKCDFLIEVSMYNEGVKNFTDTLSGICDNLNDFNRVGIDPLRIACVIIVDGIRPFYSTFTKQRGFFEQFFVEDMIKERFGVGDVRNCKIMDEEEDDEFAHCFMQRITLAEFSTLELQLIFCVKQKNKRKLNTHLWFFGGFCEFINPKFVMLIDVGTAPLPRSLFLLYEAMETQDELAGCCGEIRPMDPNIWKLVVPAQVVEYKFSHIFDKALESVLGYITVLPGAFSAYRWTALQGDPLWKDYFKSICHPELMNAFNSNIYLAEDRVLCLALISKKKSSYLIRYVRASVAETDVPENIATLMSQRRRWINGSWFSLIDSIRKCSTIFQSDHNCCRKVIFSMQMFYYVVTVAFAWVMVGAFFLVFNIVVRMAFGSSDSTGLFSTASIIVLIYFLLLLFVFVMALGAKPNKVEGMYKIIASLFGIYMVGSLVSSIIFLKDNSYQQLVLFAILGTISIFAITTLANCAVMTILKGIGHYLFLTPTYVNIFLIYAICNTHDCTWGNRPDLLTQEEKNRLEEFEEFRTKWTIVWVLCNSGFAYFLQSLSNTSQGSWYVYSIGMIGLAILFIRFTGAMLYLCHEGCCKRKIEDRHNQNRSNSISNLNSNNNHNISQRKNTNNKRRSNKVAPLTLVDSQERSYEVLRTDINAEPERESKHGTEIVRISEEDLQGKLFSRPEPEIPLGARVDIMLADEVGSDESMSEISLVMRRRRFKRGIRITQLARDTGIKVERLRDIEEGRVIPSDNEKKIIASKLV